MKPDNKESLKTFSEVKVKLSRGQNIEHNWTTLRKLRQKA